MLKSHPNQPLRRDRTNCLPIFLSSSFRIFILSSSLTQPPNSFITTGCPKKCELRLNAPEASADPQETPRVAQKVKKFQKKIREGEEKGELFAVEQ